MYYDYERCSLVTTNEDIDRAYNAVLERVFTPEMMTIIEDKVKVEIEKASLRFWIDECESNIEHSMDRMNQLSTEMNLLRAFVKSREAQIIEEVCNGNPENLYELRKMIDEDNRFGIYMKLAYEPIFDDNGNLIDEHFLDAYFEVFKEISGVDTYVYCADHCDILEDFRCSISTIDEAMESVTKDFRKLMELQSKLDSLEKGN